uniref:proline--tRNA ligase n=1 Tax=uncultured Desulfovibrio sp. TaxID=167968 RepID=UPI00265D0028
MRFSSTYIPTLKESPSEAEVVSHKLLLRAGMVRKLTSGVYIYLPLGLKALENVQRVVREEMDAAGFSELLMPMVIPGDLWKETGRWEYYGKELLRFKDRNDRDYCLGPTHEEVITDLVRGEVRSYRQLPVRLYQIQTKFRDEIRPRFGLMRGREFVMKDAYSFTIDEEGMRKAYYDERGAYERIFQRLDLKYVPVFAMSGPMGGSASEEFLAPMPIGEDTFALAPSGKAWNVEALSTPELPEIDASTTPAASKEATPDAKTIDNMIERANADHPRTDGREWQAS